MARRKSRKTARNKYAHLRATEAELDFHDRGPLTDKEVHRETLAFIESSSRAGDRGVLCFCAQHCGILRVAPAKHIDARYAAALARAADIGVEIVAYGCETDLVEMRVTERLPVVL